jgi:hypothetical protein
MIYKDCHVVRWNSELPFFDRVAVFENFATQTVGEVMSLPGPGTDQFDLLFVRGEDAMLFMLQHDGEYFAPGTFDVGVQLW